MAQQLPSGKFAVWTKSDTAPITYQGLPLAPIAIYVGGTGDITVKDAAGTTTLFSAIPAGTVLPISPVFIMSTATTATLIVCIF